ncbi:uncharacterized protein LOC128236185 isoform X2 [Mya arenaria]|uniref:uncharacterized protein LOC128236185 isoform X2 n=1 Tax=Mya arenaria TaxID=6604 RepID=UPI0022E0842E|nr:uncharacterized protein LOC128236185 isoform X2 [Mya arenaria]
MPRQWIIICAQLAVLNSFLLAYVCAAANHYGTISVVGPAFVNREVTLKATPFHPWGCHVEWKYIKDGDTIFQTMNGTNVKIYSEDRSFFLKWTPSIEYNGSNFYAGCSSNNTIKTSMTSLTMKKIVGQCGALVLLSPVVRGASVKLGYFPSDYFIRRQTNTTRTWKKNTQVIELQGGSYEEKIVSELLYILSIINFEERNEGTYTLNCYPTSKTDSVQLHIPERPGYPVLGPKFSDFNTTKCIYVYGGSDVDCKTENGTKPVQVLLLIGQDSFVLSESEGNKGSYRYRNVCQEMAGMSRRDVTCQVSNAALETPYEVHGVLCSVETGSLPVLTVPEFLHGENSSSICEVRNAFPAPTIDIYVDKILLGDVQQTNTFHESSLTFISSAMVTKANKKWNGKEMCCTRKSKYDFGLEHVSVCKIISMKSPPSDLLINIAKNIDNNNNVYVCSFNLSFETDKSNRPCKIEWLSDDDTLRNVDRYNLTIGGNSYRFNSYEMYNVAKEMAGGNITCSTRCNNRTSHSYKDDEVPSEEMVVKCTVDGCNAKGQWTLRLESGNITEIKTCNIAEKCQLTLKNTGDREKTDICKSQDLLTISLAVSCSKTADGSQSKGSGIQTFSLTFPFSVNSVLIGTGVICGLCILFVIGRCVYLKRQKISAVNNTENVENHSVPSSDNGVLHITTEGVQYAVVQRQAATRRTETQQPHDDDSLTYAELDINFLQEANARVSLRRYNMPTVYADIEFSSTQEPEIEDCACQNASDECKTRSKTKLCVPECIQ